MYYSDLLQHIYKKSLEVHEIYRKQSIFKSAAKAPVWSIYCHQFVRRHNWITLVLCAVRNSKSMNLKQLT